MNQQEALEAPEVELLTAARNILASEPTLKKGGFRGYVDNKVCHCLVGALYEAVGRYDHDGRLINIHPDLMEKVIGIVTEHIYPQVDLKAVQCAMIDLGSGGTFDAYVSNPEDRESLVYCYSDFVLSEAEDSIARAVALYDAAIAAASTPKETTDVTA